MSEKVYSKLIDPPELEEWEIEDVVIDSVDFFETQETDYYD